VIVFESSAMFGILEAVQDQDVAGAMQIESLDALDERIRHGGQVEAGAGGIETHRVEAGAALELAEAEVADRQQVVAHGPVQKIGAAVADERVVATSARRSSPRRRSR
jgi:hypothetical protein